MTDKCLMAGRFSRAVATYSDASVVQKDIAYRMTGIISNGPAIPDGPVLEVGCGTGTFSRMFLDRYSPSRMYLNDICQGYADVLSDIVPSRAEFIQGDAETMPLPGPLAMLVSCSAFQWFHDLPSFLDKAASCLSPGGILAFSTFGKENLREISELEGISLDYTSLDELELMLGRNFDVLHAEESHAVLHFDSAMSVLRHMKSTGVTGVRKEFWTRSRLENFCRRYEDLFCTCRGLPLTYHPIWVLATVKHF